MADVRRLLRLYASECPSFASLLRSPASRKFEVFLAHDEATAGNVLNPQQRMKTLLVYFTLRPLSQYTSKLREHGCLWRQSPTNKYSSVLAA